VLKTFLIISNFIVLSCGAGYAQSYSDALTRCYLQSATPEENSEWVRWTVSNLLLNPALKNLAAPVPSEVRQRNAENVMKSLERLTLVACRKEAVATLKNEGDASLSRANFRFSAIAVNNYFNDPAVLAGLSESMKAFSKEKWDDLGREAGVVDPKK